MMKQQRFSWFPKGNPFAGLRTFLILWATQALSALGSSMTSFAFIIWSYQQEGSAFTTALLSVCSYAPYVLLSIFAGALSDRWDKKKTMLVCDSVAAGTTLLVFGLLYTGNLEIWHLCLLNACNGLMNTFQQPASDVAVSLLAPKQQYQRVSGLQSFSSSLVTILTPVIATAVLAFAGMNVVILIDLATFFIAAASLLFFIRIPGAAASPQKGEGVWESAGKGIRYLRQNRGILDLIFFLAVINLIASVYEAALPAMALSREGGSEMALGWVNTCIGIANVIGSVLVSLWPAPNNRVQVICNALLISMGIENFSLAFGRAPWIWCVGAFCSWLPIPVMNANMNVLLRSYIPIEMQGRVFSARNTLQFFTIPVGYLLGGFLVDSVFEPLMAAQPEGGLLAALFGMGKGSGAAMLFFLLGIAGVLTCLVFRKDRHIRRLGEAVREQEQSQ